MEKCIWCNKKTDNLMTFTETMKNILTGTTQETFNCCSDECIDKTRAFCHYANRNLSKFLIGFAISVALVPVALFVTAFMEQMNSPYPVGFAISVIGGLLMLFLFILYPFATPQTVMLIGIKKSIIAVRVMIFIIFAVILFSVINEM